MPVRALASTLVLGASLGTPSAFAPSQQNVRTVAKPSSTGLNFGIPTFQPKNTDDDKGKGDTEEKKIDMKGLAQLITAGMGSPFLGDFEGVDKDVSSVREAHVCIRACIAHIIDLQARATPPLTQFPPFQSRTPTQTGTLNFSLEANNLVDENGESKQTSMPYFESGWVSDEDTEKEKQRKSGGGGFKLPWQK